jgi:hypothetical protein
MSRLRQSIFPFISKQRLLVESCRHRRLTPCRHRRLPPPKTARPSSVPAASPRPPLPLRRHHGHHHRQYRSYHRHHRRRCHHHHHQLPLPPPRSPASSSPGGKQAQPALLRPCALHPRPCELPAALLPASGVAGDAVATRCACSRGTLGTPATCRIVSCLCCSCMAGCGCADGLGCWKPGWRPASRKIKSGLLPQFQVARLAP